MDAGPKAPAAPKGRLSGMFEDARSLEVWKFGSLRMPGVQKFGSSGASLGMPGGRKFGSAPGIPRSWNKFRKLEKLRSAPGNKFRSWRSWSMPERKLVTFQESLLVS